MLEVALQPEAIIVRQTAAFPAMTELVMQFATGIVDLRGLVM